MNMPTEAGYNDDTLWCVYSARTHALSRHVRIGRSWWRARGDVVHMSLSDVLPVSPAASSCWQWAKDMALSCGRRDSVVKAQRSWVVTAQTTHQHFVPRAAFQVGREHALQLYQARWWTFGEVDDWDRMFELARTTCRVRAATRGTLSRASHVRSPRQRSLVSSPLRPNM